MLHWLPVKFRINFKILLITFKAINGLDPYIAELIMIKSSTTGRYPLRSNKELLLKPPLCKTYTTLAWGQGIYGICTKTV
jgi:hypothetical protein